MTLEMSSRVFAQCARCAGCVRTVIYQLASMRRFSRVPRLTRTNLYHIKYIIVKIAVKKISSAKQRNNYLNVFLCCANSVHTTRIVRETSDSASVIVAHLLLCTVIVDFTFNRLTSNFIIFSVSEKAMLTRTCRGVIISFAFGITAAEYYVACSTTFRLNW